MTKLSTLALFAAATLALSAPAAAQDLTFQLTNMSSYDILSFYTSPATTDVWEADVLDGAYFPSGNTVPITIADGSDQCVYDMKFVPDGAEEFVVYGIDICTLAGGEYTLVDAQ